jgi:DNA polymerase elongation subunit (family B)
MTKPVLIFDCEIYKDYFLAAFRNVSTGNVTCLEMYDGQPFDVELCRKILAKNTIVSFNGNGFDFPVLYSVLKHKSNEIAKKVCDYIIAGGYKPWHCESQFDFKISTTVDHIDIIEVAPGRASLKAYGGRLHTKKMQDLPIDPSDSIAPEQRELLREYCGNDLRVTQELYEYLAPQIALRETMSKTYGIDLRSKSDAQIAEHVIKSEVEKITGNKVSKTSDKPKPFKYKPPAFIKFDTELLQNVLKVVEAETFYVADSGKVLLPEAIKNLAITIGTSTYTMGVGGLHSTEECQSYKSELGYVLRDFDVASYYPAIILQAGLYPKALGQTFLKVYKTIVTERLAAKASGDKVKADSLKITINGGFGKFGSQYSVLYSPDLLIQTTITGQLALLMLIERLSSEFVQVISANTDGIIVRHHEKYNDEVNGIVAAWGKATGFDTEETSYYGVFSRDVNNYIALKNPKGYKLKGAYTPAGLMKNPTNEICVDAVVAFLTHGTPIEETVHGCKDIRKFVTIRQVKAGAMKDGEYIGRVVRFYYSRLAFGHLEYKINGYRVPRSEGAEPLMELPDALPCDINFDWYVTEAYKILKEIGV